MYVCDLTMTNETYVFIWTTNRYASRETLLIHTQLSNGKIEGHFSRAVHTYIICLFMYGKVRKYADDGLSANSCAHLASGISTSKKIWPFIWV